MRKILLLVSSIVSFPATANAQISFRSSAEIERDPYVACQAWFGISDTIYTTPDAPNHPKASTRFRYYADKFKKEQGRENINTDCLSFTQMADSLRQSHTPGYSFYNSLWKRQVTIAPFPGLPADWSTTPVPGEDGDAKPAEKDGKLKTLTVRYPTNYADRGISGYQDATVEIAYTFINCMGEIHVAYSLKSDSVKTSENYAHERTTVPVGDVPPPKPSSIGFHAKVYKKEAGGFGFVHVGWVGDKFAGPALGFGCFTGQTKEVGKVKEWIGPKATPEEVAAFLENNLALAEASVRPYEPLRNASLEASEEERQRRQVANALKESEAHYAKVKAAADATAARHKAEVEAYEKGVREAEAAKRKFEQDQAAHEAELARARAAEEEYRRQREAYREEYKKATGRYPTE